MTETRATYTTAPAPDRALIEALATRLMGWQHRHGDWYVGDERMAAPDWNPLTDPAAAALALDVMAARGWGFQMRYVTWLRVYDVRVWPGGPELPADRDADWKRALCRAALRALGDGE